METYSPLNASLMYPFHLLNLRFHLLDLVLSLKRFLLLVQDLYSKCALKLQVNRVTLILLNSVLSLWVELLNHEMDLGN